MSTTLQVCLRTIAFLFVSCLTITGSGCKDEQSNSSEKDLDLRLSRLERVPMQFDASQLPEKDRKVLRALVEASKLINEAYLHQSYPDGIKVRDSLAKLSDKKSQKLHRLIVRNGGPFDKIDHFTNFFNGVEKIPGSALYPPDLTKNEFEGYIARNPSEADALQSPFTVVRRENDTLVAIPYHIAFEKWIRPASELLNQAAQFTDNPSLRRYLLSRSRALLTDDYFESDLDWIDLEDNDYDIIIGPYEVHEDGLMGMKAAYEATVGIKDEKESSLLKKYTEHLDALEQYLPHDNKYKRTIKGLSSPMVVVTDIYRGGDIAYGYQPVATNLPNDPRVHTAKGTKKTFWKNVMDARLNKIIMPVGREAIASAQVKHITAEGFFNFVLMHELAHALGPQYVFGTNDKVSANQGMKELHPALEEAKADVAGLHAIRYFIEQGIIPKQMEKEHYVSYLASIFRTIRFGTTEPHGKAAICELNYLRDRKALRLDTATKKWSVNFELVGPAISAMAKELLTLQATGNYEGAKEFFGKWSATPADVAQTLNSLKHLPVDVEPVYSITWE